MKNDFVLSLESYQKNLEWAEDSHDLEAMFVVYTGMAKSFEGLNNYQKAVEYYKKAIKSVNELSAGIPDSELALFLQVRSGGFARSEPATCLERLEKKGP